MKPLVYLAGPYSWPDPVANTHNTIRLATRLYETGLVVPMVPHLTLLWQLIAPRPIDYWYDYDNEILQRCDAVLVLPGPSSGAEKESARAHELGLPVFESEEALTSWAVDRMHGNSIRESRGSNLD